MVVPSSIDGKHLAAHTLQLTLFPFQLRYVLTAAHCVEADNRASYVLVGEHTVNNKCDCTGTGSNKNCNADTQKV